MSQTGPGGYPQGNMAQPAYSGGQEGYYQYPPQQQAYGGGPVPGGQPYYGPPGAYMQGGDALGRMSSVNKLVIKQHFDKAEALANAFGCMCCEWRNKYQVFDAGSGQRLFFVEEESEDCMRICCNPHHTLTLRIKDEQQNNVAGVHRPFMWGCCFAWSECCMEESQIYYGSELQESNIIGRTKVPRCGGGCTPTLEVYSKAGGVDPKAGGKATAVIEGPSFCFGGCTELCCDQTFLISRQAGKAGDVATIVKEKPTGIGGVLKEVVGDADVFTVTYNDVSISAEEKMVFLSSMLFIDFKFFEEGGMVNLNGEIVCCNLYCQGCFWPCVLRNQG